MEEYIPCFSCKAKSLNIDGETHRYMLSSPGCWAMFCEVSEKEYSDIIYSRAHHYTVDSYACQHPGKPDISAAVNSVGIHLCSLYMQLEKGMKMADAGKFKNLFSQYNKTLQMVSWLQPPTDLGSLTVFDIWDKLDEKTSHFERCLHWAETTWDAWKEHHYLIKTWTEQFLKENKF